MRRYLCTSWWVYWLGKGNPCRPPDGIIELRIPTGNYAEDEGFARYLLRKQLNLRRLPIGTVVVPKKGPHD